MGMLGSKVIRTEGKCGGQWRSGEGGGCLKRQGLAVAKTSFNSKRGGRK